MRARFVSPTAKAMGHPATRHPAMGHPAERALRTLIMLHEKLRAFDCLSPLDARYYATDREVYDALHPYLSEAAGIGYLVKVEQALIAELEACGIAPRGSSAHMAEAARQIDPGEVYAEEHRVHHNIRALVNCLRSKLPEQVRGYVHLFATSCDIMDTARAVSLRDICREVILPDLCGLAKVVIDLARANADLPQIGRTHGQYAEPITVGYWLANYVVRLGGRTKLIAETAANLRGKFSGAVGAHNALALHWPDDPATMEMRILRRLGLRPPEQSVSTQIVHPEYIADFGHALVSTFSVFANLADDCRHLMRSEIQEIRAKPDRNRVGSSTMPHKVNPKDFENVKSLWKAFMPRMVTIYLDQISEHQRDLTNSASGRFFTELVASVDYAARRLRDAIQRVEINRQAVQRNLTDSSEWIVAEPLYIALALSGHPDPYDTSRSLISLARKRKTGLLSFLKTDAEARKVLDQLRPEHRDVVLDPEKYVGDAPARIASACDYWETELQPSKFAELLSRPPEEEALVVDTDRNG